MTDLDGLDRRTEPEIKKKGGAPEPRLAITSSPRTNGSLKVLNNGKFALKGCFKFQN